MIKAVLFDAGGTLISPFPSVGAIYSDVAKSFNINISEHILNNRFKDSWARHQSQMTVMNKEWWEKIVRDVFYDEHIPLFDILFETLYRKFNDPQCWKIADGAKYTLKNLKNNGSFTLCVASNWDERLPDLLEKLNLHSFFSHIFTSHDIGFSKPDPRFFRHILDTLKLSPEEVIHVGDDPELDIKAAGQLGIQSFQITPKNQLKNFYNSFTKA